MRKIIEVSMEAIGKVDRRDVEFVLSEKFGDRNLIKSLKVSQHNLGGNLAEFSTAITTPQLRLLDLESAIETLEQCDEPYIVVEEDSQFVLYTKGNPLSEAEIFAITERENIKEAVRQARAIEFSEV